jgi:hypothetical protein
MSIRSKVLEQFEAVAREQRRPLAVLDDETKLLNVGLDSLSFALIVARLEDSLGYDPFEAVETFPITFGDFVRLYDNGATR